MADEAALAVDIARDGDHLAWQVQNVGTRDLWAYLLVPSVVDGRARFDLDTGWIEQENDGTLLVRKTNAERAWGRLADVVPSGAVRIPPRDRRRGRVTLADAVPLRGPYERGLQPVPVKRVVLEVGWVPSHDGEPSELLEWQGQLFAFLDTSGHLQQRFTRSAPLHWRR